MGTQGSTEVLMMLIRHCHCKRSCKVISRHNPAHCSGDAADWLATVMHRHLVLCWRFQPSPAGPAQHNRATMHLGFAQPFPMHENPSHRRPIGQTSTGYKVNVAMQFQLLRRIAKADRRNHRPVFKS